MSRHRAAVLALALLAGHAGAAERFAVAGGGPAGACVVLPGPAPALPRAVTVVVPDRAPDTFAATITAPRAAPCGPLAQAGLAGRAYTLEAPAPGDLPWLGVARLDPAERARIRACASGEGVHLTAWDGPGDAARRLWHAYATLGHDLEPDCSDLETGDGD